MVSGKLLAVGFLGSIYPQNFTADVINNFSITIWSHLKSVNDKQNKLRMKLRCYTNFILHNNFTTWLFSNSLVTRSRLARHEKAA